LPVKITADDQFGRLAGRKGQYLGTFDLMIKHLLHNDGMKLLIRVNPKLDAEKVLLRKFDPEKIVTSVYVDNDKKQFMVKRFKIETTTLKNKFLFIKEGEGNYVEAITTDTEPVLAVQQGRGAQIRKGKMKLEKVAELSGWRTVGTRLLDYSKSVEMEWVKPKGSSQPELF
jgi:topoisomerase-4 subunit A